MFWFWVCLFYGALFLIGLVVGFLLKDKGPDDGGSVIEHEQISPTPSGRF